MKVNVYKVELLIIDHDAIGEDEIKLVLENARYPNHCIRPEVKQMESRSVEWTDDHPLNHSATKDAAYNELFSKDA